MYREHIVSTDPETLTAFEDLQPSPRPFRFYESRGEWAFEVHASGRSRLTLGIFVIRGNARRGTLITMVEPA